MESEAKASEDIGTRELFARRWIFISMVREYGVETLGALANVPYANPRIFPEWSLSKKVWFYPSNARATSDINIPRIRESPRYIDKKMEIWRGINIY